MVYLTPDKLHVSFFLGISPDTLTTPRCYTLTHSDSTGDLFLSIGPNYNYKQISKIYTRLMRDEVLAELVKESDGLSFKVYCHISGGFIFGSAKWRYNIFKSELPLVLEAIRYGDKSLFDHNPEFDQIPIFIYFKSSKKKYDLIEKWGVFSDYKI